MTRTEVAQRVAEIATLAATDPEGAHSAEDQLHRDVLRAIAGGLCDDPAEVAAAATRTLDVPFDRWYS